MTPTAQCQGRRDAEVAYADQPVQHTRHAEGAWLDNLHRALDEAVVAAYGWPADLTDDEVLSRLLTLNLERSARQGDVA